MQCTRILLNGHVDDHAWTQECIEAKSQKKVIEKKAMQQVAAQSDFALTDAKNKPNSMLLRHVLRAWGQYKQPQETNCITSKQKYKLPHGIFKCRMAIPL